MLDGPDDLQAAGALKSTVEDMLKYVQWQAAEADAAVTLSHQPTFTNLNYSAGLNWQIVRSGDKRIIWQSGSIPGFDSNCIMQPEARMGLVILANEQDSASAHELGVLANEIQHALDASAVPLP
jgi:D-alanyl-D-alanine-carboxypeptidase/D-alanyl-D-alanine-endopeptidase